MNAAPIRASDAEREEVTRLLQRAVADGRLTPEEAGERLALAVFSFWGVRMFFPFWIFGLMALGIAARAGRRYRRRAGRWHAWGWAVGPRWLAPSSRPW
jgi:hypothetical protein